MTNEPKPPSKRWRIVGIVAIALSAFTTVMSFVNAFVTGQPAYWIGGVMFAGNTLFWLFLWTKRT